jgi:hypothetical protein
MKNIFDTNARADEALVGGEPAARAVGLPTYMKQRGSMAPGGSNATADALIEQAQQQTQSMLNEQPATAPAPAPADPIVGYNPDTKEVFSQGKVFKLDLNEGRENAALFDINNDVVPQGFHRVRSGQLKQKLVQEYEGLGVVDSLQRRVGQAVSNYGSTLEDLGAESLGQAMQGYGGDVVGRNPSKITQASDIIDKPGTLISETVGELGYDLPVAIGTTAAGAAAGAKLGAPFALATGGASIPLGAILGGLAARFLSTMFETYGSVRSEQREKGIDDPAAAVGSGLGSTALEALIGPEARIGAQLAKKSARVAGKEYLEEAAGNEVKDLLQKNVAKNARDLLQQNTFKYGGKKALQDFAAEGGTEIAQSAMERAGAYNDLTGPEAFDEYAISGVKGGIGGAMISPLSTMAEFQDAKSFVESLEQDMAAAADTTLPSGERMQAARRVQDVLRGSSDDPEFDQQLQEFRTILAEVDRKITEDATKQALATGSPVNLMDAAPQQDLFNRGMDEGATAQGQQLTSQFQNMVAQVMQEKGETQATPETLQMAEERLRAEAAAGAPQPQPDFSGQASLFDETGAPTNQADPSTREERLNAQLADLNNQMDQMGLQSLPANPIQIGGVTDTLTPMQRAALAGPQGPRPTIGNLDLAGLAADINSLDPAPAAAATRDPVVEQVIFGRPLRTVSPTGGSPLPASSPAASAAGDVFSDQQTAEDLGLNTLESSVASAPGVVTGKVMMSQGRLMNARNLLLNPDPEASVEGDPQAKEVAEAAREYARTYEVFQVAYANVKRFAEALKIKEGENVDEAIKRAEKLVDTAEARAADARAALTALGAAVGGNAKDVEALVRVIKNAVQPVLKNKPEKLDDASKAYYAALAKLDQAFARGWVAAKSDLFQGATDLLQSRPTDLKRSAEVGETLMTQLRKAAEQGYGNIPGTASPANTYSGFLGVLQYIRFNGSGYDQLLARQIRESILKVDTHNLTAEQADVMREERKKSSDIPKVVFITKGKSKDKSRFDPRTNTVYIRETESPSVVLHEALHAALQHFVYTNPNDPIVVELKKSLRAVLGYKGSLGEKANETRNILRKLVADGNELDAVLELISYGNTLNEFRRAMEAIPKKGTPKTFFEAVSDMWRLALAIVRRITGAKTNTEASNIIDRTWELLAKTGESPVGGKRKAVGNVLNVEVMGGMNPVSSPQANLLQRPGASLPSSVDVARFNKRILPSMVSSKVLFDLIGWDKISTKIEGGVNKLADYVREDLPGVAKWVTYLHAQFNVPHELRNTFEKYKNSKQAGYKVSERLANYIQYQPAEKVTALFAYLDGDKNALGDDVAMQELGDDVKAWRDFYVQELGDEKAKEFFGRGKFSETMLFATNPDQVAGASFGVRKLSSLLGQKRRTEKNLDEAWMELDERGDIKLDNVRFLQVLQTIDGQRMPAGFIAESVYERNGPPEGFVVDPTYLWYHTSKSKEGHNFVANMTAKQAIEDNRADDLANALRNTMAALSGTYAAKEFAQSLNNYGVDNDSPEGRDATSVVYDSIAQANKVLGIKINPDTVIVGDSAKARSKAAGHAYRSSHLWVKVPKGDQYGDMQNKIVKASVWSAMIDMSDRKPVIELRPAGTAMRWFKKSKTIYNPGTHLTNVATNVTLATMHEIPFGTVLAAGKMFALYETAPNKLSAQDRALVRAFMNSNAMLGDFSSSEVKEAISTAMISSLQDAEGKAIDPNSTMGRVSAYMQMEKNKAVAMKALARTKKFANHTDNMVTELYSAEDNIFRLAMFLKTAADISAQTGKAPTQADLDQAGNVARAAFLDYDIDAKAVKIARQTVMPFVSWTYAIIPLVARMAVHQPWKIANVMLAYTIIEHLLQEAAGGEEEDERLRKVGPEYIRDRMFGGLGPYMHVRLPFLGDDKNPVYYRLGDYIPMAALARGQGPNAFMGIDWWPSFATPTGPFVSAILAMVGGVDPYTGKPISSPTDDTLESLWKRSRYVASQMVLPPWASIDETASKKMDAILKGRTDRTENYAALQMARYAGLKLYDYNVDQAKGAQTRAAKAIMSEYKREIGKLRRAEARFENPDWEAFREKQDELLLRMREEMAKAKGDK